MLKTVIFMMRKCEIFCQDMHKSILLCFFFSIVLSYFYQKYNQVADSNFTKLALTKLNQRNEKLAFTTR